MNNLPLFSVLIANYNNGKYLMEAIESVRQQTYPNWEIILVDDGSTDNSNDLYNDLQKDERIHVFYNNENKGCGFTKHQCVLHANGEFCGFLDPDDVLLPNALQVSVSALQADSKVVLTMSRFYFCDSNLIIQGESRELILKTGESYFEHGDFQPEVFSAFRINSYKKTSGIDSSLLAAVDQDLYFKLDEVGQIFCINEFTYKYRIHSDSLSQGDNFNWAWYWNTIVWHVTCERRGMPTRNFSYKFFEKYVNEVKKDFQYETEARVKNTLSYRVGSFLIKPISFFYSK